MTQEESSNKGALFHSKNGSQMDRFTNFFTTIVYNSLIDSGAGESHKLIQIFPVEGGKASTSLRENRNCCKCWYTNNAACQAASKIRQGTGAYGARVWQGNLEFARDSANRDTGAVSRGSDRAPVARFVVRRRRS